MVGDRDGHDVLDVFFDPIRRVFESAGELENYADGIADYIELTAGDRLDLEPGTSHSATA